MQEQRTGSPILRVLAYPQLLLLWPIEVVIIGGVLFLLTTLATIPLFGAFNPTIAILVEVVWLIYSYTKVKKNPYYGASLAGNLICSPLWTNSHEWGTGRGKRYVP